MIQGEIQTHKVINAEIAAILNGFFFARDEQTRHFKGILKRRCTTLSLSYYNFLCESSKYAVSERSYRRTGQNMLKCYDQFLSEFEALIRCHRDRPYSSYMLIQVWIEMFQLSVDRESAVSDFYLQNIFIQLKLDMVSKYDLVMEREYETISDLMVDFLKKIKERKKNSFKTTTWFSYAEPITFSHLIAENHDEVVPALSRKKKIKNESAINSTDSIPESFSL